MKKFIILAIAAILGIAGCGIGFQENWKPEPKNPVYNTADKVCGALGTFADENRGIPVGDSHGTCTVTGVYSSGGYIELMVNIVSDLDEQLEVFNISSPFLAQTSIHTMKDGRHLILTRYAPTEDKKWQEEDEQVLSKISARLGFMK